ncbi:hypothetical protein WL95_09125 [Burkholderia cepacia]|nr:hypothetical protein WL95_09125 [Burkholderia cepacia]
MSNDGTRRQGGTKCPSDKYGLSLASGLLEQPINVCNLGHRNDDLGTASPNLNSALSGKFLDSCGDVRWLNVIERVLNQSSRYMLTKTMLDQLCHSDGLENPRLKT